MLLSISLAKKIIDEVKKLFNEDISIVGVDGIIIASTDAKRIGTYHEGAMNCAKEKQKVIIRKKDGSSKVTKLVQPTSCIWILNVLPYGCR